VIGGIVGVYFELRSISRVVAAQADPIMWAKVPDAEARCGPATRRACRDFVNICSLRKMIEGEVGEFRYRRAAWRVPHLRIPDLISGFPTFETDPGSFSVVPGGLEVGQPQFFANFFPALPLCTLALNQGIPQFVPRAATMPV
jgi:hypothetical protein